MFGKKLNELRKQHELTQGTMATILECDQSMVSLYEKGKSEPTEGIIRRTAIFFKVSADYLLGLEDEDGTKIAQPKPETRNEALINNYVKIGKNSGNVTINNKNKK